MYILLPNGKNNRLMSSRSPENKALSYHGWDEECSTTLEGQNDCQSPKVGELFLLHGGSLFEDKDHYPYDERSLLFGCIKGRKGFAGLSEVLFNESARWLIEDLNPYEVWVISTLAHMDDKFRKRLINYLGSLHSISHPGSTKNGEVLLKAHFNIDSTIAQIGCGPDSKHLWWYFLTIVSWGTPSMLKPFVKRGFDLYGEVLIAVASRYRNHEVCRFMLDDDASVTPGLSATLRYDQLDDEEFKRRVDLLVKQDTNRVLEGRRGTALLYPLQSQKLRSIYQELLGVYLKRRMIDNQRIYGHNDMSIGDSYVFWAIHHDWPAALSFFLDHCVTVNALVGEKFPIYSHYDAQFQSLGDLSTFTWLTMAVDLGRPACVDILVKHGGDILLADHYGRTPLGLSRKYADEDHPRRGLSNAWDRFHRFFSPSVWITSEQDAEVLNILESAFAKLSLDEEAISTLCAVSTESFQPLASHEGLSRVIQWFRKGPHFQQLEDVVQRLWYKVYKHSKLPFREALLFRFGYVVSYLLLFLVEAVILVSHLRSLPQLPKSTLWAGLLLLLAVVWSLEAGSNGTK